MPVDEHASRSGRLLAGPARRRSVVDLAATSSALPRLRSGRDTADALARSRVQPRLTREWLDGQAARGLVAYDAADDSYALVDEARCCSPTTRRPCSWRAA